MKCKVKNCQREGENNQKYCHTHYIRLRRLGDVFADIPIEIKKGRASLFKRREREKILKEIKPGYRCCYICGKIKLVEKFNKIDIVKKKFPPCKMCVRERHLWKSYGIDLKDYNRILKGQGGKCALCRSKKAGGMGKMDNTFQVDHDHETGIIRGLLCYNCNRMLGRLNYFGISLGRLRQYLNRDTKVIL